MTTFSSYIPQHLVSTMAMKVMKAQKAKQAMKAAIPKKAMKVMKARKVDGGKGNMRMRSRSIEYEITLADAYRLAKKSETNAHFALKDADIEKKNKMVMLKIENAAVVKAWYAMPNSLRRKVDKEFR